MTRLQGAGLANRKTLLIVLTSASPEQFSVGRPIRSQVSLMARESKCSLMVPYMKAFSQRVTLMGLVEVSHQKEKSSKGSLHMIKWKVTDITSM